MKKRVVFYARVSTEHEAQISALENQVQYYDEIFKRHPEFEYAGRYIDEGITGTSVNKRKSFIQMMDDAKAGKFDLIITREVSRFARNIVDTLQQTRLLRTYGVEVWFIEDNIWTLNDEDGELRLSIMATLAQNESKKISQRVKAGQMISFKNGVLYGNGNILGYKKEGDKMVIDKEQAETVRRIFDLYLEGKGTRKIRDILEREHRLTATGLTKWQQGYISRVLKNSFYCGRIEYRKQYVPDYLTQKKVNNHGEIEKVYVEGTHERIITPEMFDEVQRICNTRIVKRDKNKVFGKPVAKCIWVRKTKCVCGHAMNRRVSYTAKNGKISYTYQCYDQLHTGTPTSRKNKGLSTEGICDNNTFQEWKLEVQASFLFKKLLKNKQEIFDTAISMIQEICSMDHNIDISVDEITENIQYIDNLNRKLESLIDLYTDGDISKEIFLRKKEKIEKEIAKCEEKNKADRDNLKEQPIVSKEDRVDMLSEFLKMKAREREDMIPEELIDKYVDQIWYEKNVFTWVLNPKLGNDLSQIAIDSSLLKKKQYNTMCQVDGCTGCYR